MNFNEFFVNIMGETHPAGLNADKSLHVHVLTSHNFSPIDTLSILPSVLIMTGKTLTSYSLLKITQKTSQSLLHR